MATDVGSAVQYWLGRAESELATSGFSQIDLDEMFADPPGQAVETALRCLQEALQAARIAHPSLDGILTIPLDGSDDLDREAPRLNTWFSHAWEYGPGRSVPGLYLVSPGIWRAYEDGEDYRMGLAPMGLLPAGFAAYYRCWRDVEEARKGWEFNRCIYVRTV